MTARHDIEAITDRIRERSKADREAYLGRIAEATGKTANRATLSCGNLAHGFAVCSPAEKAALAGDRVANLGIITSYNDMLSAHQPFETFPQLIKAAARDAGGIAQVAGGVPAMCDGVTQGMPGMELSLFSRDVIAMAAAIGLSHNMFDAAVYLGVCDKIVPGLLIAALTFGHLPAVFIPAGPMISGIPNDEKAKVRQLYAEGKVGRAELLEAESKSYHGPGTCTFYGTANSNQMLMEMMGLHVPGAAFVHPSTPLRDALTAAAVERAARTAENSKDPHRLADVLTEKAFVNGVVGLMATGGSTNHALHLPAMARAAGVILTWEDMNDLSAVVPLLARVYPNGSADVNHFHAAGGVGFVIRELLSAGLLHEDVETVWGHGLGLYAKEPVLQDGALIWRDLPQNSLDEAVLRPISNPFQPEGGLRECTGNLGHAIVKVSAVKPEHQIVEAPCVVFDDQDDFLAAFKAKDLPEGDFICVVRFQGPKANGMPELHSLTPSLSSFLDAGRKVALVTDGRMSGASGKVPAMIHLTPEALDGGPIARLKTGDVLRVDCEKGTLDYLGDATGFANRTDAERPAEADGVGRELFAHMRRQVGPADQGGAVFW